MTQPGAPARKILLLITDLQIGGTPTVVRELATRLNDPPSVQVDVACLAGRGPVVDQLCSAGVKVIVLGARRATDVSVFFRLRRLIAEGRYDTVFSFLIHANTAAAVVSRFLPGAIRYFQSIQTTQPNPRWHWRLQSIVHHACEQVVVPSPSVAQAAQEWAHVPANKLCVISNAIDLEGISPSPGTPGEGWGGGSSRRSKNPLPNPPPEYRERGHPIGFLGRLDPIKRISDLLEAVNLLGDRVHLHIFGEGSERENIERRISELGIASHATLHRALADPRIALDQISLLVLPSQAEGFGLVLIEAMAAGVPVVATNVPGIRDVVRHEQTGLLVPVASPTELAAAIKRLLDDHELRQRLIDQAESDVRERFTWRTVLSQYRRLLGLP
jgi:glycosyltransferase involved in cell wall biosynthesis